MKKLLLSGATALVFSVSNVPAAQANDVGAGLAYTGIGLFAICILGFGASTTVGVGVGLLGHGHAAELREASRRFDVIAAEVGEQQALALSKSVDNCEQLSPMAASQQEALSHPATAAVIRAYQARRAELCPRS